MLERDEYNLVNYSHLFYSQESPNLPVLIDSYDFKAKVLSAGTKSLSLVWSIYISPTWPDDCWVEKTRKCDVQNEPTFVRLFIWLTKNNTNDYEKASYAAGMNFSLEKEELLLKRYHPPYWIQVLVETKWILFNERRQRSKRNWNLSCYLWRITDKNEHSSWNSYWRV